MLPALDDPRVKELLDKIVVSIEKIEAIAVETGLSEFGLKVSVGSDRLSPDEMRGLQFRLDERLSFPSDNLIYQAKIWGGAEEHTCSGFHDGSGFYITVNISLLRSFAGSSHP